MNITKKELPKKVIELTIELSVEEIKPYLEKAAERLSAEKPIKGFRPGKAPFETCVRQFGEMALLQNASTDMISDTYYQTLEKEKLETIDQPKLDIVKMAPGNSFIYKATASLLPKIEICEYIKIKVKKLPEITIEDAKIEQVINDLRKMRAKEMLVDRAAQQKDRVEINFDTFVDKVPIDGGQAKKYPIVIGDNKMIPGFEEQVVGLKKDDTKEFELSFPKDYHQKSIAGKKAKFKVKVLAVYQIDLPELNDDFSKALGLKDVEGLKNQIRINLTEEQKQKNVQKQELEIIEQLIEKSTFEEIPDALVNDETHKMVHELEDNIGRQGLNFEDYLKHLNKTEGDLMLDFTADALKRVKTALAIREISRKEKIEATDQEIEDEQDKTLASYKLRPEYQGQLAQLEKSVKSENAKRYFGNLIANRKVIQFLKDNITVS
ncbi:MAG TPA: trigger factor [Candidatus Bipolaricaulota bacterium]|nr:trigger factor [Candidatus Bipolaricaulota bacterium]